MRTAELMNPLNLEVTYVRSITPPHEVTDEAKRESLTAAMDRDGWTGAPIVTSRHLNAYGQDRAYTGSHRIEAWSWTDEGDASAPIPCVFIEDIADTHGIDWGALMAERDGDDWEAATALCYQLPQGVLDAYGLDCGGA
jgi:hypothetical protein